MVSSLLEVRNKSETLCPSDCTVAHYFSSGKTHTTSLRNLPYHTPVNELLSLAFEAQGDSVFLFETKNLKLVYSNGIARDKLKFLCVDEMNADIYSIFDFRFLSPRSLVNSVKTSGCILFDLDLRGRAGLLEVCLSLLTFQSSEYCLIIGREFRCRKHIERYVWECANLDPLTDLPNRRLFKKKHQESVVKYDSSIILYIDIDKFKLINDTYGHQIGDEVLKIISKRLKRTVRKQDLICRHGGDEFVVVFNLKSKVYSLNEMEFLVGKVRRVFDDKVQSNIGLIGVQASIGVFYCEKDMLSLECSISCADKELYKAKRNSGETSISYNFTDGKD